MSTSTAPAKAKKTYYYPDKYKKKPAVQDFKVVSKNILRDLVIKHGYSVAEAAAKFDIDEGRAERLLYTKNPTAQQYEYALEIYDKGLSMVIACVAAGVSPSNFAKARRERVRNAYRPLRW